MDLLQDNIKQLYFKFLTAAFGSAFISSIYGVVDMAMVGQYHGPQGSAAMGVIAPVWNLIYSLGLLTGIGGSVLFSVEKGRKQEDQDAANACFTVAAGATGVIALVLWVLLWCFETPMLRLFGADNTLLPLCRAYLTAVKWTVPVYLLTQLFSSFLRNDAAPSLAARSVLAGGLFNVAGDYVFVFVLDLGIRGAGIATALGACISAIVMATHFFSKKNTIRFVRVRHPWRLLRAILVNGFSTFLIDVAMGVLTMLFNRQIMRYLGADALAVYAVIVNVSTFVQCCAYGVGQASQPILSQNFGAGRLDRLGQVQRYSLCSVGVIGAVWTAAALAIPGGFIRLFMAPTDAVLAIAPAIFRVYGLSFLLLPLNIYATYYFQAVLRSRTSILLSAARGILISGALILILPVCFGGSAVWWSMPVTEAATAAFVLCAMARRPGPAAYAAP